MKKKSTFREEHDHETAQHHSQANEMVKSFDSVEALIRHDANRTIVPKNLRMRLNASIGEVPKHKSWWRRLFDHRK